MLRRGTAALVALGALAVGAGALVDGRLGSFGELGMVAREEVVEVVRVVDGDTIRVRFRSGDEEPVRYIGVDTPEVTPGRPVECYGRRTSAANRRLVGGRQVRLEWDRERRDRYGRSLAYVHRLDDDELFVNAELVRRGFATTLRVEPNVAHAEELGRLAGRARDAGRGLWAACPPG